MPPMTTPDLPQRRHGLCRCVFAIILTLIFLVGLIVLISWLTIKPKRPFYSIDNVSVQKYNLARDNHLSANIQFTIQFHNPNHKITIFYDSIEVFVKFNDQTLAFDTVEPFRQKPKNVTQIDGSLFARNVPISQSDAKDIRVRTKLGKVDLDVYVRARVRYKVWIWKSRHRTAKIECSPVTLSLSQPNKSRTTHCEADV